MKKFLAVFFVFALSFAFLTSPSILYARGGHGGGFHGGGWGGHWGWRGYGGYYGWGYRGYYPYWGFYGGYYPYYWGFPAAGWPYAGYGGWPYAGSSYYYPPTVTETAPAYNDPGQQQPYYWYFCEDPKGYYPYVKSCPGGWIPVLPNATPPNR